MLGACWKGQRALVILGGELRYKYLQESAKRANGLRCLRYKGEVASGQLVSERESKREKEVGRCKSFSYAFIPSSELKYADINIDWVIPSCKLAKLRLNVDMPR